MGYGSSDELNYFLILIYMDSICDELKEDMHKIEEDSKKIDCYAILDLIGHCIQCFIDSIKCCFKIKVL